MAKKKKKIDLKNLKAEEKFKYEIAKELGYIDKIMTSGWESLTARESGQIGGMMTKRSREMKKLSKEEKE